MKIKLFIALTVLITGVSCSLAAPRATPVPHIASEQLLVDVSVFPPGWYVELPPHVGDEDIGQLDDRWVQFRWKPLGPLAGQEVYCFAREKDAAIEYKLQMDVQFFSAERLTAWETPMELPYVSPVADQFRLACANFRDFPSGQFTLCTAMAQYDECLSIFSTSMSSEHMAFEDLKHILVAIDNQAKAALHPPGESE